MTDPIKALADAARRERESLEAELEACKAKLAALVEGLKCVSAEAALGMCPDDIYEDLEAMLAVAGDPPPAAKEPTP